MGGLQSNMTGVPIKRGNLNMDTDTQREGRVKTRMMLPQAKKLPEAEREAWKGSSPNARRLEHSAADHLDLGHPTSRTEKQCVSGG